MFDENMDAPITHIYTHVYVCVRHKSEYVSRSQWGRWFIHTTGGICELSANFTLFSSSIFTSVHQVQSLDF